MRPTLEYHLTTVSSQRNFRHSIEFAVFRCLGVWRFNTLESVHKITKFSVGLYKSNLVTIFVIKQINVSQWWEGNIKKTASHLYVLLVTSLSTKFLAGQMWMKSDKWQMRTQLKAQKSSATQPQCIIHRTLQPCFLLLCFRLHRFPL
jgi:hypothetical protein